MTANGSRAASPPLHTTTVRFDVDLWARLCLHTVRLGVGKGTLINMAVREFIARREAAQQLEPAIQEAVSGLEQRLRRIEAVLRGRREARAVQLMRVTSQLVPLRPGHSAVCWSWSTASASRPMGAGVHACSRR